MQSAKFHIQDIRRIRSLLPSTVSVHSLISALFPSGLDYCNSFAIGIAKGELHTLQMVQNYLARIIIKTTKLAQILIPCTGCSLSKESTQICHTVHKVLHFNQPTYLCLALIPIHTNSINRSHDP